MKSANLVLAIPASSPSTRHILISAHYDSAGGPGASDNASGVALLLEIARYFKQKPAQPGLRLEFAALGAEELVLLGSRAFLLRHAEILDQYELVFNLDTVGGNEDIHVEMLAGMEGASGRRGVGRIPVDLMDKASHDNARRWSWLKREEIMPMASCVPAWLEEEINAAAGSVIHGPGDTADKISLPNLEKVAALVIRVVEKTMAARATQE